MQEHYMIHKQTLNKVSDTVIHLPYEAKILSVQLQNGVITLWYMFDTRMQTVMRVTESYKIKVFLTGEQIISEPLKHLATLQEKDIVYHVFMQEQQ